MPPANCANCGARLPKDGRFCPECGVRTSVENDATAVEEIPPEETGRVPVHTVAVTPRYFGIAPPLALFALAVAALAAAIVVFVAGKVIAGALLLAAAALFSVLFVTASKRLPENAVARVSRRVFATARDRTGFAVEAVSVHSTTRVELFRLRRELSELVAERAEAARALGEAVYVGAEDEIEAGRNRMSELEQALADKEGEMTRVTAAANERIQRAQLQVQPTEVVEPPEVPEPMPAPSEPPQPVIVPEPSPVPSEPPMPVPSPEPSPEPSPPQPEQPS
ncbi:MAG TPA: zinc ribbon domain-containing protein [Gaiellaceae bacterium]|nr:zinc ribbon domain-containing protein [Gaiellaceae bacterium]